MSLYKTSHNFASDMMHKAGYNNLFGFEDDACKEPLPVATRDNIDAILSRAIHGEMAQCCQCLRIDDKDQVGNQCACGGVMVRVCVESK